MKYIIAIISLIATSPATAISGRVMSNSGNGGSASFLGIIIFIGLVIFAISFFSSKQKEHDAELQRREDYWIKEDKREISVTARKASKATTYLMHTMQMERRGYSTRELADYYDTHKQEIENVLRTIR